MHHLKRSHLARGLALVSLLALGACSSSSPPSTTGGTGGGTSGTGGHTTGAGGSATGTGGSATGTGGSATGAGGSVSTGSGGSTTGAGGSSSGGAIGTGGHASGGSSGSGGAAGSGGTAGNGGAGGHLGTGGAAGAGSSGGQPGSGGTAGGSSGSCKYKLCEDFESSTVGSIPSGWTSFKGYNNTIGAMDEAVAMDAAHSGTKALKSIAASQGTARVQKALSSLGATANKHWGRVFYKVQSPSAVDSANYLHVTFVSLLGGSTEDRIVDTVAMPGSHVHQWLFNAPDDNCCTSSQYSWTFDDAWHCAEWYIENQQGQVTYRFFSDSKEVTDIGLSNRSASELPTAYDTIVLGATYYQHDTLSGPFTMWFDDLAINDTQIGCQ